MAQLYSQFYPPHPRFTEKECGDLSGKVFMVTGGYAGVGFELVKLLYQKNGAVYIAGRNPGKAESAMKKIRLEYPASSGRLEFLLLDLDDFSQMKARVENFLAQEERLDVLWNNAGVMTPPVGSKNKQGFELQLGTNCMAAFLLTQLLRPLLIKTAQTSPNGSVRVLFTASLMAELQAPKGGVNFDDLNFEKGGSQGVKYAQSKAANILIASEFAHRVRAEGVVCMSLNPGNLKSELQRHGTKLSNTFNKIILHDPIYGAYTELFAGLSPEVSLKDSGRYVIPWGRFAILKKDIDHSLKSAAQGGSGAAARFWLWCEEKTKQYM